MEHTPSEFSNKLSYYQSANTDNASIKANFIIRIAEYDKIINALKAKKAEDPLQHELILGRRGSGKSTLLKRLQIEIDENPKLNKIYIAVNLAEEQTSIYRLFDLWLEVINECEDRFNSDFQLKSYTSFDSDDTYTRYLYDNIHQYLKIKNKKLVLLLDNFDRIIGSFNDDGNLLRETLINYNDIQIIGGSTRMSEHFWQYDLPFYEFFRQHRLEALSTKEMMKLILHWSDTLNIDKLRTFVKQNPGKIEAVRLLTDGLPRTLQFFIEILLDNSYLYGYEYLKRIMDKVTPVYQERLNTLTPQLRKIVTEMAFIWEACSTKQLVEACRMQSKLVSANLKTLVNKGIVTKIETGSKNHLYRISERFFNMWFIITQGNPVQKRKAKWLSIFLECWYDEHEFKDMAQTHIKNLAEKKMPYDKALLTSKAFSQSKYTTTAQRDEIIDLVEGLQKTNTKSLIQLPKRFKAIVEEITTLFDKKQYDKAIALTEGIENEEDGIKFTMLGMIFKEKKDIKNVEKYYLLAIEKGHVGAMYNLALLYEDTEKFEDAKKYYLLAIEKGDVSAMYNLGSLYHDRERFGDAEKYYLLAVEKGHVSAMFNLALLYTNTERFEDAEKYYVLAIEKRHVSAMFNLALLYAKTERFKDAEKYYLLAIKNGDVNALNNLGLLYDKAKRFEDAKKYYLLAIKKGQKDALNNLAAIYYFNNENKQDALSKIKAFNISNRDVAPAFLEIIIEIWNGIFNNTEKRIQQLISNNLDAKYIENGLIELIIHQQKQIVYNVFNNYVFSDELKNRYMVLDFVVSLLVEDNTKQITLTIPPEIKGTVDSVLNHIKERQVFYGYSKYEN